MLYPILALSAAMAASPPVTIGGPARAFTLPAINEEVVRKVDGSAKVSLFDFAGVGAPHPQKAVVVHFFERGAGDDVLSVLSALDRKHDDIMVIGVTTDPGGLAAITTSISQQGLDFPVLFDEYRTVFGRYGIDRAPITLVIDADGDVTAVGRPGADAFQADLEQVLAPLLAR